MGHLEGVSVDALQDALDEVEGKRPAQRLLAAIAYKNGVSQTDLAEWYDVERKTVYNWLTRLEDETLDDAATDDHRSGRNPKLPEKKQEILRETLRQPPTDVGYDEPAWTTALVQHHVRETYDVVYSLASCRQLLKDAGLSYQKPRPSAADADPEDRAAFHDNVKKSAGRWTRR